MAKKQQQDAAEQERLSRKEYLRQRKQDEQTRQIRLAIIGVGALLVLILLTAVVVEYVVRPRQAIARVGEDTISLGDWQERVRFERAQILIGVENAVDTFFNGDIGQAQLVFGQQLGQQLTVLQDAETFGEQVLNQMIDELLVRQEAQSRGIEVTEEEVNQAIGERYSYYDGGLPTPAPTGTNTPVPTPSVTPIPTEVLTTTAGITIVATLEPTPTATVGPTSTPLPTSTPVSLEAFEEAYGEELAAYKDKGVNDEMFFAVVEQRLYEERLAEALAAEKEDEIIREELQMSLYVMSFGTALEAVQYQQQMESSDFLTVWNTVRSDQLAAASAPVATETITTTETASTATATEYLWRNKESLELTVGVTMTAQIMDDLEVGQTSEILFNKGADGVVTYYLVQVSGRELRPVTDDTIEQQKATFFQNWLQEARVDGFVDLGGWRNRAPRQPAIDPAYLQAQPTFTPEPVPTVAEEEPYGNESSGNNCGKTTKNGE